VVRGRVSGTFDSEDSIAGDAPPLCTRRRRLLFKPAVFPWWVFLAKVGLIGCLEGAHPPSGSRILRHRIAPLSSGSGPHVGFARYLSPRRSPHRSSTMRSGRSRPLLTNIALSSDASWPRWRELVNGDRGSFATCCAKPWPKGSCEGRRARPARQSERVELVTPNRAETVDD
jgi:hypothetical protein